MNIFISILGIILTIFVIIGIHEFGHFIAARFAGIKVLRFSIGFGKPFYRWRDKKNTEYALAPIPLGGYVKLLDETESFVPIEERHLAFNQQPLYKKIIVILAGPLSNFLLAFFLYWLIFMIGFTTIAPVIGKITPHSIAAQAGLQPQEEIIRIENKNTSSWGQVLLQLMIFIGTNETITIHTKNIQSGDEKSYSVALATWHVNDLNPKPLDSLGIKPFVPENIKQWPKNLLRHHQYHPIQAGLHAIQDVWDFTRLNFILIGKMFTGKVSLKSLGGPITIFETAGAALNVGIIPFLSFLAFLSIAIAVLNILPIPGLDGGHLLFYFFEIILGKPLSPALQALIYRLGFIVLIILLIQAIANDLMRINIH